MLQLLGGDARVARERVVHMQHRDDVAFNEAVGVHRRVLERQLHQRHVELLLRQPPLQIGRHARVERGGKTRALQAAAAHGFERQAVDDVVGRQDAHAAAHAGTDVAGEILHLVLRAQQAVDMLVELLAFLSQLQAAAAFAQDRKAGFVLELREQAADLRLRAVQPQRGLRDAAALDESMQRFIGFEVHRISNTCEKRK